jgi:hypothetical protein
LGYALARRILAAEPELVEKLRSGFAAVVIAVPNADMVLPLGDGQTWLGESEQLG